MSTFNVHEWNRKRRLAALKENELKEGAFGDKAKVALENRLTGMAKAMVEDGDLFAEGGNVTYDENDLKDGATPEQIEAIDQIKAAVIEMGGRVNYGVSDEDGTLTYMYLVVDEPPTYDAVLKVITKENNEPNLFRSVFKEEEQVNEGKVKDFLLKALLKTTDVVSPDTLKYVYSELVKQVGEDKANESFQELGVDPSKYKE